MTRRPPPSISSSVKGSAVLVVELISSFFTIVSTWPFWPPYRLSASLLRELGQLAWRLLGLVGRDVLSAVGHAVEDVGVALAQRLLRLLAVGGVELGRVVEDAGERRGLLEVELGGVLAEVGLGGGLDAVGAAAEVDGVEVALEDLLLADLLRCSLRERIASLTLRV